MAKKIHTDEIDESFIISSIKQDRTTPSTTPSSEILNVEVETKNKKSKAKLEQYEELFFKVSSKSARLGKAITIRPEFHDNISRILHLLGDSQITLFSYIDNILAHHFESYKAELNELYDNKYQRPKFLSKK